MSLSPSLTDQPTWLYSAILYTDNPFSEGGTASGRRARTRDFCRHHQSCSQVSQQRKEDSEIWKRHSAKDSGINNCRSSSADDDDDRRGRQQPQTPNPLGPKCATRFRNPSTAPHGQSHLHIDHLHIDAAHRQKGSVASVGFLQKLLVCCRQDD